jgi:3-oxoacyl-(acyl-carrier-protein) synthase
LELSSVPAVSFKSQFGHTTNASGIFELGLAAHCMRRGVLMKVLNSEPQDPAIEINVVHEKVENQNLKLCLGIAMGFGGLNGSYLLEKALA